MNKKTAAKKLRKSYLNRLKKAKTVIKLKVTVLEIDPIKVKKDRKAIAAYIRRWRRHLGDYSVGLD